MEWEQEMIIEMHRAIAEQLLRERSLDESANYELNEKFTKLATEQQAETMDPSCYNEGASVCALCKRGMVRRIGTRYLTCEIPGCFEITLPFDFVNYRVEDVMTRLQVAVYDHF
jgi:hypothetical protein